MCVVWCKFGCLCKSIFLWGLIKYLSIYLSRSVTPDFAFNRWFASLWFESLTLTAVPILDFWGPTQNCVAGGEGGESMDETHLSVFHSVSNRAHGKLSRNSLFRCSVRFQLVFVFFPQTRDCTTFTLHDLTDFYVERVTAHRIKRNDHSCFHNSWPNSKRN